MEKEKINIERYIYIKDDAKYRIYPIEENDTIGFWIEKEGYGIMSFTVGMMKKDFKYSIEDFINKNIDEWILICDSNITE